MSAKSFVFQRMRVKSLFRSANKGQNSQSVHVVIFDWRCKWCLDKRFPLAGISIFFPVISPFSAAYLSCTPTIWTSPQSPSSALSEKRRGIFTQLRGNTIICTLQGIHETLLLWSMRTQPDPWHRTTAQTWTLLWGRHRNKHFIVFMWEWSDRLLCSMQLVTRQSRNWTCNFLIKGWASAPKRWKNSHCWNLKTAKHFLIYYR